MVRGEVGGEGSPTPGLSRAGFEIEALTWEPGLENETVTTGIDKTQEPTGRDGRDAARGRGRRPPSRACGPVQAARPL